MMVHVILTALSVVLAMAVLFLFAFVRRSLKKQLSLISHNRGNISANRGLLGEQGQTAQSVAGTVSENAIRIGANKDAISALAGQVGRNESAIRTIGMEFATMKDEMRRIQGVAKDIDSKLDAFRRTVFEQAMIRESRLLVDECHWILEDKGESKCFAPGRIVRANSESRGERSDFSYDDEGKTVTCTVRRGEEVVSEIRYTQLGAPLNGKLYRNGKVVREFEYNELGQVI